MVMDPKERFFTIIKNLLLVFLYCKYMKAKNTSFIEWKIYITCK
jgi:hypothetical protein